MNKLMRKIFALLVIICILSGHVIVNAAIVSDNDGSTFVTKFEFDTLKNDFANQIDNYSSSIDGKIDGAISAYLAGVTLAQPPENYWDKLTTSLGGNPMIFKNKFNEIDVTAIFPEVNISIVRDLCAKGEWGITCGRRFFDGSWGNGTTDNTTYDSVWLLGVGGTNAGDYVETYIQRRLTMLRAPDTDHTDTLNQYETDLTEKSINWSEAVAYCSFTNKKDIQASVTNNVAGAGKAFIYHRNANGNLYLKEFASSVYPVMDIDVWRHDYKDFSFNNTTTGQNNYNAWYRNDNGKAITDATINVTATPREAYGAYEEGTKYDGYSTTSGTYISTNIIQLKATDGNDYSLYQYGTDLNNQIYCLRDNARIEKETSTSSYTASGLTWIADYFNNYGKRKQTNNFNNLKLTYTKIKQNIEQLDPSGFVNTYATNVAGETVYLGGGAPILYTQDGDQDLKIKIKFSSNGTSTDTVHYIVSDKQFVKGAVAPGADVYKEDDVQVGTEVEVNLTTKNKQVYWINLYSNTSGKDATISSLTFSVS